MIDDEHNLTRAEVRLYLLSPGHCRHCGIGDRLPLPFSATDYYPIQNRVSERYSIKTSEAPKSKT